MDALRPFNLGPGLRLVCRIRAAWATRFERRSTVLIYALFDGRRVRLALAVSSVTRS